MLSVEQRPTGLPIRLDGYSRCSPRERGVATLRRVGIVYRIDQAVDCMIVVWNRDITADDQVPHLLRLAADPDWPLGRHLTDRTTVGEVTLPDPLLIDALVEGSSMRDEIARVILVRPGFLAEQWIQDSGSETGVPEVPTSRPRVSALSWIQP